MKKENLSDKIVHTAGQKYFNQTNVKKFIQNIERRLRAFFCLNNENPFEGSCDNCELIKRLFSEEIGKKGGALR